jgi:hypothetical protein
MTMEVREMWRVVEVDPPFRRGTVSWCFDEEISRGKVVVVYDDGTRWEGRADLELKVSSDENKDRLTIHSTEEDEPQHRFEVMRSLPVTAPTVHQHVVSIPVIPRARSKG